MKRALPLIIFLAIVGGIGYWLYKNRTRFEIIMEFFEFLKAKKLLWITPIIVVLLLLGIIIIVGEGGALATAIYTLF